MTEDKPREATAADPNLPRSIGGRLIGGRYRVERLLGQGGMGEVYAAKNLGTGRDVALKVIRGASSAEQNKRFLREAKATTAIAHPHVIEVLDVFEDDDGTPVMVMELLRGETLGALKKREGALPLAEVATLMLPVAEALRAAHQKGVVHRDMKPENVFLDRDQRGLVVPKVLDFGIAKITDPTALSGETQGGSTSTGSILGTPHYMSMEQAMSDKNVDHRADIWSIGVMLYELLVGKRPLEFENLGQMYQAFLQGDVPKVRDAVPSLPADMSEVIDRCLAKKREDRLSDLGELIAVLARYADPSSLRGRAIATEPPLTVSPTTMPTPSATGAAALSANQTSAAALTNVAREGGRSRSLVVALGTAAIVGLGIGAAVLARGGRGGPSTAASALPTESAHVPTATLTAEIAPTASEAPLVAPAPTTSASAAVTAPTASATTGPTKPHGALPTVTATASSKAPPIAPTASAQAAPHGIVNQLPY